MARTGVVLFEDRMMNDCRGHWCLQSIKHVVWLQCVPIRTLINSCDADKRTVSKQTMSVRSNSSRILAAMTLGMTFANSLFGGGI